MGVGGQRHAPAALPPGKTRHPLYRRLGGLQGSSERVRKISPPPTGIRSPDRPALSESLYRLRYPAPHKERIAYTCTNMKMHRPHMRMYVVYNLLSAILLTAQTAWSVQTREADNRAVSDRNPIDASSPPVIVSFVTPRILRMLSTVKRTWFCPEERKKYIYILIFCMFLGPTWVPTPNSRPGARGGLIYVTGPQIT